jgi:hypothetical protein
MVGYGSISAVERLEGGDVITTSEVYMRQEKLKQFTHFRFPSDCRA